MPLKVYRGLNTGNSIRSPLPNYEVLRMTTNEGFLFVSDTGNGNVLDEFDLKYNVYYSIKKKRRWMLGEVLRQRMMNGEFDDSRVEIVEAELTDPYTARTTTVAFKAAGPDKEIVELNKKRGFINKNSAIRMLRKQEGETDPQAKRHLHFEILDSSPKGRLTMTRHSCTIPRYRRLRPKKILFDGDDLEELEAADDEARMQVLLDQEGEISSAPVTTAQLSDCVIRDERKPKKKRRHRSYTTQPEEAIGPKNRKVFCLEVTNTQSPDEDVTQTELDPMPTVSLEDDVETIPIRMSFPRSETQPEMLQASFGDCYVEGQSLPRKFAIRLNPSIEVSNANAFVVFEELHADEAVGAWDVFLQADVTSVKRLSLDQLPQYVAGWKANIRQFVSECSKFSEMTFKDNFVLRELPSVVNFAKRTAPLCHQSPFFMPYRPCGEPWRDAVHYQRQHPIDPSAAFAEMTVMVNAQCEVCLEPVAVDAVHCDSTAHDPPSPGCSLLGCGHMFCNICWRQHLVYSIRQGHLHLLCPANDCKEVVDVVTAMRFVSLPLYALHARLRESDGLLRDRHIALCPNRACGRVVRVEQPPPEGRAMNVLCVCRKMFCYSCREEGHWPASCHVYRLFKTKMLALGDSNLYDLIKHDVTVEGKNCPVCNRFIEKNGGCNSMICVCRANFCWHCSKLVSNHDHGVCYITNSVRKKPVDFRKVTLYTSNLTPSPSRSRHYCDALKFRIMRLSPLKFQRLHQKKLKQVLFRDKIKDSPLAAFDIGLCAKLHAEVEAIVLNYSELLSSIEFCLVCAFMTKRSRDVSRRFILESVMDLSLLAKWIREVAEGQRISRTQTRTQLLYTCFEQARGKLQFLARLRVFTDPKAVTSRLE